MSTPQNLTLLISPIPKKLINLWFPSHTKTKFKNHPLTNSHSRHWRQISTNDKNLSQTLHTIMPHQSSHPPPAFRAPKFQPLLHNKEETQNTQLAIWAFSSTTTLPSITHIILKHAIKISKRHKTQKQRWRRKYLNSNRSSLLISKRKQKNPKPANLNRYIEIISCRRMVEHTLTVGRTWATFELANNKNNSQENPGCSICYL
jgi:hypothetical protein